MSAAPAIDQTGRQAVPDGDHHWCPDGRILYDSDLRAKLVSLGNAPPGNFREAVAAFRAIAPKVKAISWHDGQYHLAFDFLPKPDKIVQRFRDLDHREEVAIHKQLPDGGIVLWTKSV